MSGREVLINGYQPTSICVFLIHKIFFKTHNLRLTDGIMYNDVEFSVRLMPLASSILFKDAVGYCYYRDEGSITKPKTKLEQLHYDEVILAGMIKDNINNFNLSNNSLIKTIKANYNNVIWNLIWQFVPNPKEFDKGFKRKCISDLRANGIYLIKEPLKTRFQMVSRPFFNFSFNFI